MYRRNGALKIAAQQMPQCKEERAGSDRPTVGDSSPGADGLPSLSADAEGENMGTRAV